jgi:hypothetical protein
MGGGTTSGDEAKTWGVGRRSATTCIAGFQVFHEKALEFI